MSNKRFFILSLVVIILSLSVNHKIYGNSNVTMSNYERIKYFQHKQNIKKRSKPLADYMYNRIKFYQEFDTWYERDYTFRYMYQELQKMEIK